MIKQIYAIKDELAKLYSGPFIMLNKEVAMRSFHFMAEEREESEIKDNKAYLIGLYNDETGEIKPIEPKEVCDLEAMKKEIEKNG